MIEISKEEIQEIIILLEQDGKNTKQIVKDKLKEWLK